MLKLFINQLIFLCILFAQLFCKKKLNVKTYENKVSYLFLLLYSILFFYTLYYGCAFIDGEIYAINIVIYFIIGMIFAYKQCIILVIVMLIFLYKRRALYGDFQTAFLIDIISSLVNITFGRFCKTKIYKDSYPGVIYSVSYSIILVSIYAIISLIVCIIDEQNGIYVYDYLPTGLTFRIIWGIVILGTSFIIFSFFDKEKMKNRKSLINIFVKKYNILIIVFCIFAAFFSYICVFIYLNYNHAKTLEFNFQMAKNDLEESRAIYGDDYMEKDATTKELFDSWTLELSGGVYVIDENFNIVNDFKDVDESVFNDNVELANTNFTGIINYERNKIFKYTHDGHSYMLIYDKIGNYYVVGFFLYKKIFEYAFVPASVTIFVTILNVIIVFMLVYSLFKKFVLSRLWEVNNKLNKITSGNYDVVLTDNSSNEFSDLSESINKTVDTLKSNIEVIEKRNREELVLARRIQVSQLPIDRKATIAYSSCGLNIPAEDVGGDFYDNFSVDNKHRMFLIADVSGKGIPAALFMMKAKHTIMNLAKQHFDMGVIFEEANKILSNNNDALMFVTCFAMLVNLETGEASLVNAGHNKPIIRRYVDGKFISEYIDVEPCHIIGIDSNSKYSSSNIRLNKNDSIILYTDGVTEAKSITKEQFGTERLLNVVSAASDVSPKMMCDMITDSVYKFADGAEQSDDITIQVINYNGDKNTLRFDASFEDVDMGKKFLDNFINLYDINVDIARNLRVVFDEVVCNIVKYAYDDKKGDIIFDLNLINNNTIEMVYKDRGKEFNPTKHVSDKKTAEDKILGGMGIMFCMNMMDECKYERKDGYNIFTLRKKLVI